MHNPPQYLLVQALYKECRCYFTHHNNIMWPQWDNSSEQTTVNELTILQTI